MQMTFIKMFCTVKLFPQGVLVEGILPTKSYLRPCLRSVVSVTVSRVLSRGEELRTNRKPPVQTLQLALFLPPL